MTSRAQIGRLKWKKYKLAFACFKIQISPTLFRTCNSIPGNCAVLLNDSRYGISQSFNFMLRMAWLDVLGQWLLFLQISLIIGKVNVILVYTHCKLIVFFKAWTFHRGTLSHFTVICHFVIFCFVFCYSLVNSKLTNCIGILPCMIPYDKSIL